MIKHQGEAGEDREGRVGGLWCTLVASGLTTGLGQVGSQPLGELQLPRAVQ